MALKMEREQHIVTVGNTIVAVTRTFTTCEVAWHGEYKGRRELFEYKFRVAEGTKSLFKWFTFANGIKHMRMLEWLEKFVKVSEDARFRGYKPWDTWHQSVTDDTRTWVGKTCPRVYEINPWIK